MTMWLTRIAYWIPKATNTYLEHMILIVFPLQQWLQERARMLPYAYMACLAFSQQHCGTFNKLYVLLHAQGLCDLTPKIRTLYCPELYTAKRLVTPKIVQFRNICIFLLLSSYMLGMVAIFRDLTPKFL
jgi:hypothetical protein